MTYTHRIAVVGAGVIGTWHAKVVDEIERGELACVIDTDPLAAKVLAQHYGVPAFDSLAAALAGEVEFEIVAVCVPSGMHAGLAVQAMESGKHVIVEKPIDITLAAADRIIAAQRTTGLIATVIHQHRYDQSSRALTELVSSGSLGRLTTGLVSGAWWRGQSYYDSGDWRGTWDLDGGGALMNQGIHATELLVNALGRPLEVMAYSACLAHERLEVEDTVVAVVKFESGALGTIQATTAAFPGVCTRIQVHGDRGSVVIENDQLTYVHAAGADLGPSTPGSSLTENNQVDRYVDSSLTVGPTAASNPGMLSDSHRYQYEEFLTVIESGGPLAVTLEHGRLAVALTLAIYESARTGGPAAVETGAHESMAQAR
jgi:predicted dehydrogenase